jgi:hypothetical protein
MLHLAKSKQHRDYEFVMAVSNDLLFQASAVLYVNDVIDEDDFVAVYEDTRLKSPEFQYWRYEKVENQLQFMTMNPGLTSELIWLTFLS